MKIAAQLAVVCRKNLPSFRVSFSGGISNSPLAMKMRMEHEDIVAAARARLIHSSV